jgi:hypothetical protein
MKLRTGVPVIVALMVVVAAAVLAAEQPMTTNNQRVQVFSKDAVPPQVAGDLGGSVKEASEAPDYTVLSSDTVKMYQSSWVRVVDKARDMAQAAGASGIVVTDWGFDPSSSGSVKKTERVKKISFDIVRF